MKCKWTHSEKTRKSEVSYTRSDFWHYYQYRAGAKIERSKLYICFAITDNYVLVAEKDNILSQEKKDGTFFIRNCEWEWIRAQKLVSLEADNVCPWIITCYSAALSWTLSWHCPGQSWLLSWLTTVRIPAAFRLGKQDSAIQNLFISIHFWFLLLIFICFHTFFHVAYRYRRHL